MVGKLLLAHTRNLKEGPREVTLSTVVSLDEEDQVFRSSNELRNAMQ
jgi:hypothetical protein